MRIFFGGGALLFAVMAVNAQSFLVADDKVQALQACQKQSAGSPKLVQKQMLISCQCIVEHTDFKKAKQLRDNGKPAELQQLYDEAASHCGTRKSIL